ncbi:class I SAM-dependent methyltransferase [Conexibacter stalactiti]|uniref:Class I SAM-dependent methyltransferase n=1 Tax=Conexibacter stalactiti TaxID=1940611 RepID=A0ABU4HVJ9_9ACTN|nr:class I SAM-dependent methyltransferase [Conexibacter stalactiti]MDW5597189.1 class I SAM-dependent methyltransferase [Conexibacter stalactiti]MEC5037831.1 class I SAM-dependent methyltransferase [Conexibacter stalactiti]
MTATTPRSGLASRLGAALYDPVLALGERRGMRARRTALLAGAHGRTLEIGAGTGRNLDAYPATLDALLLSEPDAGMLRQLRRTLARSGRDAELLAAGAEALPLADASVDTVVSTMVLCTVLDPRAAIRELRRVLAPGGQLLFVEHVRADSARLARWQDRLAAPWAAVGAGCRCNQPTRALLEEQFARVDAEPSVWRGMPPLVHPLLVGRAVA